MSYGNPIAAGFTTRPAIVRHVRLVVSVRRKSRRIRGRCARRRERQDHDPAIFLDRRCPTIDRAQIPAFRRLADVEPNGAFGCFVENEHDVSRLADRGSLQRQWRTLGLGGRRRRGVRRRRRRGRRRATRRREKRPFARGGKRAHGHSPERIARLRRLFQTWIFRGGRLRSGDLPGPIRAGRAGGVLAKGYARREIGHCRDRASATLDHFPTRRGPRT
jgi:hypothetical protein